MTDWSELNWWQKIVAFSIGFPLGLLIVVCVYGGGLAVILGLVAMAAKAIGVDVPHTWGICMLAVAGGVMLAWIGKMIREAL